MVTNIRTGKSKQVTRASGFTLIELMITVAIVAIIAAIALPAYQSQVEKTRRTTAQADLMELAQWMERSYANGFDYREVPPPPDPAVDPTLPYTQSPKNGTSYYTLSFSGNVGRDTFTLQAVPTAAQAGDNCGTMTLDEQGTRGADQADCW